MLLQKNLPIIVPGWEDSTMGNIFASYVIKGELKASTMKSGIEYMTFLADWYTKTATKVSDSSKLEEELPETSLSVLYQCYIRIWKCMMFLSGAISVRFQIRLPATVPIQELFQMRKSLGVN